MKVKGLKKSEIEIKEEAILDTIRYYTREAGVRGMEREIAKLCRKVVTNHVKSKKAELETIDSNSLEEYLGVRKFDFGRAESENQVGQVTGLAWSQVGAIGRATSRERRVKRWVGE